MLSVGARSLWTSRDLVGGRLGVWLAGVVRRLQDEVRDVVCRDGVIARRAHPELRHAIKALKADGELVGILPGVYGPAGVAHDFAYRVAAAAASDPDLVYTGATAARLTWWPKLATSTVVCTSRWQRVPRPGFEFSRGVIPPELVVERRGLRITDPALTALDLCATYGGDGIDRALRQRVTTLERMRAAMDLTPGRPGNVDRRRLLLDSRDNPWSAAERRAHRLLRGARITGWKSNWPVVIDESRYWLDIAFPALRLVVEIDGRLHEDDPDIFENDRERQNALVLDGWTVLRFTWRMLLDEPDRVVTRIRAAIRRAQSSAS